MTRYVFAGTYTQAGPGEPHRAEGIYVYRMDPASGRLEPLAAVEAGPNPSFVIVHPGKRLLYAVNEGPEGQVCAFALDPRTGSLSFLNRRPTGGEDPCYLSFDPSGRWLLAANYTSGSLSTFPIEEDGRLGARAGFVQHEGSGPNAARQEQAHAHSIRFDPSGRFALAADLGLDRVWVYQLDAQTGALRAHTPPGLDLKPGAGPRHLAFHPNGRFVYVSNELDSTVTACAWDAQSGRLRSLQSLTTLPAGYRGQNDVADIHLTPDGRFLYVSNRGDNSLAVYRLDGESGRLSALGQVSTQGNWPRNFAIDPDGRFLLAAHQYSDTLVLFRLDPQTGLPRPTGQVTAVPKPVCVEVVDL